MDMRRLHTTKTPGRIAGGAALLAAPLPLAAQEAGGGLFALDPGLSIWTIAVFLLVLFVLGKFAWKPLLGAVEAREEGIRNAISEARETRYEAEKLLEEHRKQLADARRQAQEVVAEGREAGERLRKELEARAREDSEEILERARREIERERDRALDTIRRESVELALAAASRILQERLDQPSDRKLLERFLSEVEARGAAAPQAEA
jgi:F-type H+-transporting ATPase subunit b